MACGSVVCTLLDEGIGPSLPAAPQPGFVLGWRLRLILQVLALGVPLVLGHPKAVLSSHACTGLVAPGMA